MTSKPSLFAKTSRYAQRRAPLPGAVRLRAPGMGAVIGHFDDLIP